MGLFLRSPNFAHSLAGEFAQAQATSRTLSQAAPPPDTFCRIRNERKQNGVLSGNGGSARFWVMSAYPRSELRLRDLVAETMAAEERERRPAVAAAAEREMPATHRNRKPLILHVAPHRRPRRLHPLAAATAMLLAFCGALYAAHNFGWSTLLLTKLDTAVWPKIGGPSARPVPVAASIDDRLAGPASPSPAIRSQHPSPANVSDETPRGWAEYQQRMLDAANAESSSAQPHTAPGTTRPPETAEAPKPAAREPQEATRPSDQNDRARRADPKEPAAAKQAAPRRSPSQRNMWDTPGYMAR